MWVLNKHPDNALAWRLRACIGTAVRRDIPLASLRQSLCIEATWRDLRVRSYSAESECCRGESKNEFHSFYPLILAY